MFAASRVSLLLALREEGNICGLKRTTQDPSFARCNYLGKLGKSDLEFLLFLLFTHESIIMSIEECLPEK